MPKRYRTRYCKIQQQGDEEHEAVFRTHQGPLNSGDYIHIQSFDRILKRLLQRWDLKEDTIKQQNLSLKLG